MNILPSGKKTLVAVAAQALLLLALLVPMFPGVFLRGEVAFPANTLYLQAPWKDAMPAGLTPQHPYSEIPMQATVWYTLTAEALKSGRWPLWNPFQFTGTPLLANCQTAIFYPPRLIFTILGNFYIAFTMLVLLRVWLSGFTAYLCGRGLGLRGFYASFFSVAYMLGGYTIIWSYYPPPDTLAWLPLLFLATEWVLQGCYRRGLYAMTPVLVLMILGGHPSSLIVSSIAVALYSLLRMLLDRTGLKHALRCAGCALASFGAALMVCAVQLLPFIELNGRSVTFIQAVFGTPPSEWIYKPQELLALWTPRYFGTMLHGNYWADTVFINVLAMYMGVSVWIGAAMAFRRDGRTVAESVRIYCLLGVSAVSLALAAGVPGTSAIMNAPVLTHVRPVYFLAFVAFALPLVAAISFQQWFSAPRRIRELWPAAVLSIAILGLTFFHLQSSRDYLTLLERMMNERGPLSWTSEWRHFGVLPTMPQDGTLSGFVTRQVIWTALLCLMTIACLALACTRRVHRAARGVLITLVLGVDLAVAFHGMQPTAKRSEVWPETSLMNYLREQGHPCRISFDATELRGHPTVMGIEELSGYDAQIPRRFWQMRQADLSESAQTKLRAAYATPLVLSLAPREGEPAPPEGLEMIGVMDGIVISRDPDALPRARLVSTVKAFDSTEAMIEYMNSASFDPAQEVLVDDPVSLEMIASGDAAPGTAEIVAWEWDRVIVEVNANQDAALALAEAFYPGWRARIDGERPLDIFPAYHLFRGVIVPQGHHVVEFAFRPPLFRAGLCISIMSLIVMLVIAASRSLRGRARGEQGA